MSTTTTATRTDFIREVKEDITQEGIREEIGKFVSDLNADPLNKCEDFNACFTDKFGKSHRIYIRTPF